jgi:HK97 family phage prohead protease
VNRFCAEFRSAVTGNRLEGHAAVFDRLAQIRGGWEQIAATAFDEVLRSDPDVMALINHDPGLILDRTRTGSLKLGTDSEGLTFEATIPDTSYGRDLREQIAAGLMTGCSFGFLPGRDELGHAPDGRQLRTHTSVKQLLDVSVVATPAYGGTDVTLRSQSFDPPDPHRAFLDRARYRALLLGRNP